MLVSPNQVLEQSHLDSSRVVYGCFRVTEAGLTDHVANKA